MVKQMEYLSRRSKEYGGNIPFFGERGFFQNQVKEIQSFSTIVKRKGKILEYYENINKILNGDYNFNDGKKIFLNFIYEVGKINFEAISRVDELGNFIIEKYEILFKIDLKKILDLSPEEINLFRNKMLDFLRSSGNSFDLFKIIFNKILFLGNSSKDNFAINIENDDIIQPTFQEDILELLHKNQNNLKNQNITFELLEHTDIKKEDEELYIKNIKFLNEKGFKISIDDLFSGYSTMRKVNWLLENNVKINSVKIDMELIHALESLESVNMIEKKNFLFLLKNKGIKIIAEGIENNDHLEYAKSLGAEYFQGYMIE